MKRVKILETVNYCLKAGEEKQTQMTLPCSVYSVSEQVRQIVAKVLEKESGKQTMAMVLKKAKSEKLVMFDFGLKPSAPLPDEIRRNEKDILKAFLHSITVASVELKKAWG